MKTFRTISTIAVATGFLILSCGQKDQPETTTGAADLLPEKIESLAVTRSSEPKLFEGEALYEHINGGAEVYHLYDFKEVASAYYMRGEIELVLDIYRFGDADLAYGLFSSLRPDGAEAIDLGVDGFATETTLDFVKGAYLVSLTGYEDTPEAIKLMRNFATELEKGVTGRTSKPEIFAAFPSEHSLDRSERVQADSFLGHQGFNWVNSMLYVVDGDTAKLFLADDPTESKFMAWADKVADKTVTAGLPFDDNRSMLFKHSYYDGIIAGLVDGRLVGIIGYREEMKPFLASWLQEIKQNN